MKRYEMIKKHQDFTNIINQKNYRQNACFIIYREPTTNTIPHYGIAISKKIGNAVVRNKLKRQVRNIIDNNKKAFKNNYNYIIMIRRTCLNTSFQDMNQALASLLKEK